MKKLGLSAILALAMSVAGGAQAQDDYPSETIEIIVPFGPGGSTDTSARLFASVLGDYLPNNPDVVVVNKPGGATTIGMTAVAQADPDGYTIGLTSNSPVTIQPHFDLAEYDLDSFTPIIKLVGIPQVLMVRADAPWSTFDELLAWARENPGEFVYATPGNGSISDLAMAVLNEAADINTRAIPYDSGGKARAAMLGGNVDGVATFQGNADPEQVNVLLNFSGERSDQYPDVPTLRDAGYDAQKDAYIGIVAPAGLAPERVQILHDAFKAALENEDIRAQLLKQFYQISYGDAANYAETMRADYEQNGDLLRRAGLIE